jgi:nucleotide-binding universal stress UspA family protein
VTETIVVGYDAGEPAKRALDRAIADAKASHGRLVIVSVEAMPLDPYSPPTFGTLDDSPANVLPVVEPDDLRLLTDEAVARADAEGVPAEFVWAVGDPGRTIVDAARDKHATKIIVGTHHHNLLQRLFGEDVAAAVQREATCDVIVVE